MIRDRCRPTSMLPVRSVIWISNSRLFGFDDLLSDIAFHAAGWRVFRIRSRSSSFCQVIGFCLSVSAESVTRLVSASLEVLSLAWTTLVDGPRPITVWWRGTLVFGGKVALLLSKATK
jgi:hypothetical protein